MVMFHSLCSSRYSFRTRFLSRSRIFSLERRVSLSSGEFLLISTSYSNLALLIASLRLLIIKLDSSLYLSIVV